MEKKRLNKSNRCTLYFHTHYKAQPGQYIYFFVQKNVFVFVAVSCFRQSVLAAIFQKNNTDNFQHHFVKKMWMNT